MNYGAFFITIIGIITFTGLTCILISLCLERDQKFTVHKQIVHPYHPYIDDPESIDVIRYEDVTNSPTQSSRFG